MTTHSIQMTPNNDLTANPPACTDNWNPSYPLFQPSGWSNLSISVGDIVEWTWTVESTDADWAQDTSFQGLSLKSMTVGGSSALPDQYFQIHSDCGTWYPNLEIENRSGCTNSPSADNFVEADDNQIKNHD